MNISRISVLTWIKLGKLVGNPRWVRTLLSQQKGDCCTLGAFPALLTWQLMGLLVTNEDTEWLPAFITESWMTCVKELYWILGRWVIAFPHHKPLSNVSWLIDIFSHFMGSLKEWIQLKRTMHHFYLIRHVFYKTKYLLRYTSIYINLNYHKCHT